MSLTSNLQEFQSSFDWTDAWGKSHHRVMPYIEFMNDCLFFWVYDRRLRLLHLQEFQSSVDSVDEANHIIMWCRTLNSWMIVRFSEFTTDVFDFIYLQEFQSSFDAVEVNHINDCLFFWVYDGCSLILQELSIIFWCDWGKSHRHMMMNYIEFINDCLFFWVYDGCWLILQEFQSSFDAVEVNHIIMWLPLHWIYEWSSFQNLDATCRKTPHNLCKFVS